MPTCDAGVASGVPQAVGWGPQALSATIRDRDDPLCDASSCVSEQSVPPACESASLPTGVAEAVDVNDDGCCGGGEKGKENGTLELDKERWSGRPPEAIIACAAPGAHPLWRPGGALVQPLAALLPEGWP